MRKVACLLYLLLSLLPFQAAAQVSDRFFYEVSPVVGLSKDGSSVLFQNGFWLPSRGFVSWGGPNNYSGSTLTGVSRNGFWMSGFATNNVTGHQEPYLLDQNGDVVFPGEPSNDTSPISNVSLGISGDGATIVSLDMENSNFGFIRTWSASAGYNFFAFIQPNAGENVERQVAIDYAGNKVVWSGEFGSNAGYQLLELIVGAGSLGISSTLNPVALPDDVSPDGTIIFGHYFDGSGNLFGFRYDTVTRQTVTVPGFAPTAATDDGFAVVGAWQNSPHGSGTTGLWTPYNNQIQDLTSLVTLEGAFISTYLENTFIAGDGSVIASNQGTPNQVVYITQPSTNCVSQNQAYTVLGGRTTSIPAGDGVLTGAVNLANGTAQLQANAGNGSVGLNNDGSFNYTPNPGFSGTDSFTFSIHRDLGNSNVSTVTLNVLGGSQITVATRLGVASIPDGTIVTVNNNDGTSLSPVQRVATVGGVAAFGALPPPTGVNTSYEIVVSVPAGAAGKPAVVHAYNGSSTTVYLTPVRALVTQTLSASAPVAYAAVTLCGLRTSSNVSGFSGLEWLPDGTVNATALMTPGVLGSFTATLGPSTSGFLAAAGYAELPMQLTRVTLTARTSAGLTYIPTTGTWSVSPGGYSSPVTGQVVSSPFWLPNGTYTATLSGATMNGSSSLTIGPPVSQSWHPVVVVSGPRAR